MINKFKVSLVLILSIFCGQTFGTVSRSVDADFLNGSFAPQDYVKNGGGEIGIQGWATYADGATVAPVDGTGGSPTLIFTRTTSTPLRGDGSFLITTTAANLQGNGASYLFATSKADQAKVLSVTFDYNIASGTYADGDMTVWIYDVTNSLLIQPSGSTILGCGSAITCKQIATFQTSSNSTSYRLILQRAVTTASAMTMKIDNVYVGPQTTEYGAPITDWNHTFTPTSSWTTNTSVTGIWMRQGPNIVIQYTVSLTGAPNASTVLTLSLPPGLTIDTTRLVSTSSTNYPILGYGAGAVSGNGNVLELVYFSNTVFRAVFQNSITTAGTGGVSPTAPQTWGNGDQVTFTTIPIPIVGWGSTVQMSNDTDTRVVSALGQTGGNPTDTPSSASVVQMTWATNPTTKDTHGGWSTGSNQYVVQVPGIYDVDIMTEVLSSGATAGQNLQAVIFTNGVAWFGQPSLVLTTGAFRASASAHISIDMLAGQIIKFATSTNMSGTLSHTSSNTGTFFSISRRSGPSAIAASETVAFTATGTTATTNSTGLDVNNWVTTERDTHNAFVKSTGVYSAPTPGWYSFKGQLRFQWSSAAVGNFCLLSILKNGTTIASSLLEVGSTSLGNLVVAVTRDVYLSQGDAMKLNSTCTTTTPTILNSGTYALFSGVRTGN